MLVKTYRLRLYLLYIVPVALMAGLIIRLYFLQVVNQDAYQELADAQHFDEYNIIPMRGKIFDSNGHELAGSVILDKAHVNIRRLPKAGGELLPELASELATVLADPNMPYDEILKRLQGKVNEWPFLGRGIDEAKKMELRQVVADFKDADVPPNLISFVPENKRRYSRGGLAPHVIGYTQRDDTGDNKGVAGVERTYNDEMRGQEEKYTARKSATGNPMEPADPELVESTFGHSVKLTIDESIQAVTQNVLAQGVEKSMSDAGVAVCYHVKTGEVLAMASYPSYNLNALGKASPEQRRNRALTDPIEPGSVMKIITFASLFDDNKIEPFDLIDCESGYWVMPVTRRIIKDSHELGVAPVSEVFQYSSNIGTIKAASAFEKAAFYQHLKRFGFGEKTGIDLPGEGSGILADYHKWSSMSMSSIPIGYEIQLTAIQVVAAVGAIANKGMYMQPHVVKEILDHSGNTIRKIEPEFVRSVASPEACRKVVDLMELVVENGTAKVAKLENYRVGGKTGTTKKYNPETKHYFDHKYIASFCGIAPIEDPEVCIYVWVDNPRGEKIYGGQIAAPIFREIAREAMRVLRIPERRKTMPADDFRKTLEQVRNDIEGRVPIEVVEEFGVSDSSDVSPDIVPDLRHLSLAEAVKKAASAGLEVHPTGSGVVVKQDPSPYETIEGDNIINITLTNSQKSIALKVDQIEEAMGLEDTDSVLMASSGIRPVTSVSLALEFGGSHVKVPLDLSSEIKFLMPASKNIQSAKAGEESLPDMDQFANQSIDLKANHQSWENFEKQLKELEKREDVQAREAKYIPENIGESGAQNSPMPVPVIDGTEDLDPTVHSIEPIEISTPEKQNSELGKSGASLYDLM